MFKFWFDHVIPQYEEKLCYIDTDSCIVYTKANYIHEDIGKDAETRFDSPIYEWDKPLPIRC